MRYFVVTDIFGAYDGLIGVLNQAGFDKENPEHSLISLGNLLDFGNKPKECLEYIMSIPSDRRILIQGSHEIAMVEALTRGGFTDTDRNNGLITAARLLSGADTDESAFQYIKEYQLLKDYINQLQPYYETEGAVYVSGWIPCYHIKHLYDDKYFYLYERKWREASKEAWEYATKLNGMEAWDAGITEFDKTIICGNYPAPWGHYNLHHEGGDFVPTVGCNCPECVALRDDGAVVITEEKPKPIYDPFQDNGIVNLNGCGIYGGIINTIMWDDTPVAGMPVKKYVPESDTNPMIHDNNSDENFESAPIKIKLKGQSKS